MAQEYRDKNVSSLVIEIDKTTKQGTSLLQKGNLQKAKDCFESAFKSSKDLKDDHTERACALNVGAVMVALHQAEQGLQYLQRAIPPHNQRDRRSNGDLYYNFGLAYEILKNDAEAVKYYELAFEEYQTERDNVRMEAEVACRAGVLYSRLQSQLQAARSLGIAAKSYAQLQNFNQQALTLCQQALQFLQCQRYEDSVQAADDCMMLCQRVQSQDVLGKLYNELGLIYTQCHNFSKAATCFELALPIISRPPRDKRCEAIILQNLGAVYNSLGDYQRALGFHERAASVYAEVGNRSCQGQCFINLAFAYSQLGDTDTAGECYLHAVQAAKDGGDKRGQWQGLEGLGAVCFNQGNIDKAEAYFKVALRMLTETAETNHVANDRLVAKLSDVIECKANVKQFGPMPDQGVVYGAPVQTANVIQSTDFTPEVLVNDLPRPPTREEQMHMNKIRSELMLRKVPNEHGRIAFGMGEYSTEDDLSIQSSTKQRSRPKSANRRPRSAKPNSSKDFVDMNKGKIIPEAIQEESTSPPLIQTGRRNKSSRQSTTLHGLDTSDPSVYHRRPKRTLLRTETNNSELEYNRDITETLSDNSIIRQCLPGFSGDESLKYKERLRPPSTEEDSDGEKSSTLNTTEKLKNKERLKQILLQKNAANKNQRGSSESELDEPSKVGTRTSKVLAPQQSAPTKATETSSSAEGDSNDDDDDDDEENENKSNEVDTSAVPSRADTSLKNSSEEDAELIRYQQRIRRLSMMETGDNNDSDVQSDEETEDSETVMSEPRASPADNMPPKPPTLSPPQTLKPSGTYEEPLPYKLNADSNDESEEETTSSEESERDRYGRGGNFFRTPTPRKVEEDSNMTSNNDTEKVHYEAVENFVGEQENDLSFKTGEILTVITARSDGWLEAENSQGTRGLVPITFLKKYNRPFERSEGPSIKTTVPDPDDPLYQTIRSVKVVQGEGGTDPPYEKVDPSGSQQLTDSPELPPRNSNDPVQLDQLSRAEREEFIKHRYASQFSYAGDSVYGGDENIPLPRISKKDLESKKRKSQYCVVM